MTAEDDRLRCALRDLADVAEPTDLYERALGCSRRIARREATIGACAAVVVIGVLVSGLWGLPHTEQHDIPVAAASQPGPSSGPSRAPTATVSRPGPERPTEAAHQPAPEKRSEVAIPPAEPSSLTLADLPGHVFYSGRDIVRLSPSSGESDVVLADAPSSVGVSPDGRRIAFVTEGRLLVSESGREAKQVADGVADADQAPVWSPAGDRLLIDAAAPGVLDLGTGTITPLPSSLATGQHFRWSGDGNKLVYATSSCDLKLSADDAAAETSVAVPGEVSACKPTSVDATGERVTVPLQTDDTADTVIDTATGRPEVLPVEGTVIGTVFDPDGNLLVRTADDSGTVLWLFGPDNELLVRAIEPSGVRDLDLLAYTR
ncbi:PD40 domain-containing protein [Actinoplanes solisilvae]|uniref:PD40 domain-containing protein n=1 Tax=Actinoplanes solisilvae TaxID=2486853 RepID=UPI000FDC4464|nr:PD40 domain-containing protein [Actinoplanes solisilvae]